MKTSSYWPGLLSVAILLNGGTARATGEPVTEAERVQAQREACEAAFRRESARAAAILQAPIRPEELTLEQWNALSYLEKLQIDQAPLDVPGQFEFRDRPGDSWQAPQLATPIAIRVDRDRGPVVTFALAGGRTREAELDLFGTAATQPLLQSAPGVRRRPALVPYALWASLAGDDGIPRREALYLLAEAQSAEGGGRFVVRDGTPPAERLLVGTITGFEARSGALFALVRPQGPGAGEEAAFRVMNRQIVPFDAGNEAHQRLAQAADAAKNAALGGKPAAIPDDAWLALGESERKTATYLAENLGREVELKFRNQGEIEHLRRKFHGFHWDGTTLAAELTAVHRDREDGTFKASIRALSSQASHPDALWGAPEVRYERKVSRHNGVWGIEKSVVEKMDETERALARDLSPLLIRAYGYEAKIELLVRDRDAGNWVLRRARFAYGRDVKDAPNNWRVTGEDSSGPGRIEVRLNLDGSSAVTWVKLQDLRLPGHETPDFEGPGYAPNWIDNPVWIALTAEERAQALKIGEAMGADQYYDPKRPYHSVRIQLGSGKAPAELEARLAAETGGKPVILDEKGQVIVVFEWKKEPIPQDRTDKERGEQRWRTVTSRTPLSTFELVDGDAPAESP